MSSGSLNFASANGIACSVEVWVRPTRIWTTGAVLTFYNPADGRTFTLEQDYTDLVLLLGDKERDDRNLLRVPDVFRKPEAFLSVTSDGRETLVYIDGQLAIGSPDFQLSAQNLPSQLILANSPFRAHSWRGQMKALAIYASELDAAQVLRHYHDWIQGSEPALDKSEQPVAMYPFLEHGGSVIHNAVPSGIDLEIPKRFLVVDQLSFDSPVSEFHSQGNYLKNALINVAGFVPLGFMACLYFAGVRRIKHAPVAAVLVGAAVSFTIEYFQSFLPTRYSGWTDIVTNTIGTAIGVALYCYVSRFVASKPRVGSSQTQSVP